MTFQTIRDSFAWAMKETLRRGGRPVEGTVRLPQNRRLWYVAARCAVGVGLFLVAWILLALFSRVPLAAALAAAACVMAVERKAGLAGTRGEYLLSRALVGRTESQDYDNQLRQGVFLALWALRPLAIVVLCAMGKPVWFAVALPLSACAELDVLDGRPTAPLRQWRTYAYWWLGSGLALVAADIWAMCHNYESWFLQIVLAAALAYWAPSLLKGLTEKIPAELPLPMKRSMVLYAVETALMLVGILAA